MRGAGPQQLPVSIFRAWAQRGKGNAADWLLFPVLHAPTCRDIFMTHLQFLPQEVSSQWLWMWPHDLLWECGQSHSVTVLAKAWRNVTCFCLLGALSWEECVPSSHRSRENKETCETYPKAAFATSDCGLLARKQIMGVTGHWDFESACYITKVIGWRYSLLLLLLLLSRFSRVLPCATP